MLSCPAMHDEPEPPPNDPNSLVSSLEKVGWYLTLDDRGQPVSLGSGTRHLFAARVFLTVFCLIWTGICVALRYGDGGPFLGGLFTFFAVLLWAALIGTFRTSAVEFNDTGMTAISRLGPFWSSRQTLEKRQIVLFEAVQSGTAGNTRYFRLKADTIFNRKYDVARDIAGEELARRFASFLSAWAKA